MHKIKSQTSIWTSSLTHVFLTQAKIKKTIKSKSKDCKHLLSTVANKTPRQLNSEKYYSFKNSRVQTKKSLRSCTCMISSKQSYWSCRWLPSNLCKPPLNQSTWKRCTVASNMKSSEGLWMIFAKSFKLKYLQIKRR